MSHGLGRTIAESTPTFTPIPRPPEGAPNVVVIVLDDLGFAQLGCFGGDIPTPNIDALAAGGVRFSRFHVTSLCSPTRASLLTGRNHHAVGMGFLTDIPTAFPGYTGRIPDGTPTMPRLLRDAGYSAYAVGKWHLAPRWEQSASGPFDRWPLGLGFERFYGFLGGDTNQWTPALVSDNGFVEPPRRPEDGYHLSEDLVDRAISLLQDQQQATPDKPFLLWLATGAMHAPHQAPPEWIDAHRGRFDAGWEAWRQRTFARQVELGIVPPDTVLTERPSWVQGWATLSPDERRVFARMMEVFAGYLAHTDAQIGRLTAHLEATGMLDDTMVILLSDNGTSAEGGPLGSFNEHRFVHDMYDDVADLVAQIDDLGGFRSYGHYPWGWAWAGNTPLRLWKRYTWLGGVRTPLVVRWPAGTAGEGGVRNQFCHAVDVLPTVLDAVGIDTPEGLDGRSLVPALGDGDAPSPRSSQYFEMLGSRAMYADGWKATTDHIGQQLSVERELLEGSDDYETDRWLLFDLEHDFSESTDVAGQHPEIVKRLTELWWADAGRNNVLPLDDSFITRAVAMEPSPNAPRHRTVFHPGGVGVAEDLMPGLGAGFRLVANIDCATGADEGVLCALGDWSNGWAVYVRAGRPVAAVNLFGDLHRIEGTAPMAAGAHEVVLTYRRSRSAGRLLTLAVDGEDVASCELRGDLPFRWQIGGAGMHLGHDTGFPVSDDYQPPAPFTGILHEVAIEIPRLAPRDPESEVATALKHE